MWYPGIKLLHEIAAALSIAGFMLRGFWMLRRSPRLDAKLVRVAPHVIDTVFLLSGIALVWILQLSVTGQPWLVAKLLALVLYVVLGTIALRRGRNIRIRAIAFVLAIAVFAYIVGVALSKSPASWLALSLS